MMNITDFPLSDRRTFIKSCLRFGIAGGLLIGAAVIGFRNRGKDQASEICQLRIPCKGCRQFNGCNFSRARIIKNTAKGEGGRRAEI
jgi:hypothetical protein